MKGSNIVFKNVEKIIRSDIFKYLFIALAFLNVLAYVTTNSMLCLVTFIIAYGAADNWVSKILAVNLFVALFIANVVFSCGGVKESFSNTNNDSNNESNGTKTSEAKNDSNKGDNDEKSQNGFKANKIMGAFGDVTKNLGFRKFNR